MFRDPKGPNGIAGSREDINILFSYKQCFDLKISSNLIRRLAVPWNLPLLLTINKIYLLRFFDKVTYYR